MYKRTEKARKQSKERKNEAVYLGTYPEHSRDRIRRKTKNSIKKTPEEDEVVCLGTRTKDEKKRKQNKLRRKAKNRFKKEVEDEVVYLSIRPPKDRFRNRIKDKKWHK